MIIRLVHDFEDRLDTLVSLKSENRGSRLTLLITPTVVLVTLTVLTLALCARRMFALVVGENLTGSSLGVVFRIYMSAPEVIIL